MKRLKGMNLTKEKKLLLLCFFLPFIAVIITYIIMRLSPFGGRSLVSMDGFSQYYPMLMNEADSIKRGELTYSFSGALGFNLWAQRAYYTNSPFWLLLYIIPHAFQATAIDIFILLKISFAGFFFGMFLFEKSRGEEPSPFAVLFSTAYALSGYMLSFINQLMWTDVIVLLPLVVLGLRRLFFERRAGLYIFTLALSIWSCFYIAYMVCIFLCLYFLYLCFAEKRTFVFMGKKFLSFVSCSLVAGLLSAASILPVYFALQKTHAGSMGFDEALSIKYTLTEFLRRFLPFQKVSLEFGAPNLYCSLFAVIIFVISLFNKKIPKRERIADFLFITFMSLSMSINLGEYIWHGFHFPNQLPARQSFLFIFLILSFAFDGIRRMKFKPESQAFLLTFVTLTVAFSFIYSAVDGTWASNISSLQKYEKEMTRIKEEIGRDDFYRIEWTEEKNNNLPQQCTYNGICYYSSTMSADAYDFFQSLDLERYAERVSTHYGSDKILDDLFGIEYLVEPVYPNSNTDFSLRYSKNEDALSLGYLAKREAENLTIADLKNSEEPRKILLNAISPLAAENYEKGLEDLRVGSLSVTSFKPSKIKGNFKVTRDGLYLLTIPYDEGWKILLDGKETDSKKAVGYLLSFDVSEGAHELELRYTPRGLPLGTALSILALAAFILILVFERKRNSRISE